MITKENIQKIELDYNCHSVEVRNYYITVVENSARNPENQGERINLMTVGQFEDILDEIEEDEDSTTCDLYKYYGVSRSDFI